MNTFQYDPISPVQVSPALQSGANANYSYPSLKDLKSVDQFYDSSGFNFSGDSESFSNGGAAIATTVASLLGSLLNYYQQKKLLDIQQNYQKEFFDYTFGKQTSEKWKEIEYNTPFRQLQRYLDAGLNANLLYGTLGNVGASSGNAPANAPSGLAGQMPTVAPFFDAASPIQALLSPLTAMSQIDLNRSQSYKNYKAAGLSEKEANRLSLLTPLEVERMNHDIEQVMAVKEYYEELIGKYHNENLAFDKYYPMIQDFYDASLEEIRMRNSESYSRISLQSWQEMRIMKEITDLIPSQARANNASASERLAAAYKIYSLTPEEKRRIAASADLTEQEAEWYINNRVVAPLLMGAARLAL